MQLKRLLIKECTIDRSRLHNKGFHLTALSGSSGDFFVSQMAGAITCTNT